MINNIKLVLLSIIDVITSIVALAITIIFCWIPSWSGAGKTLQGVVITLKKFASGLGGTEDRIESQEQAPKKKQAPKWVHSKKDVPAP